MYTRKGNKLRGASLIELSVTIAVASILFAALASFSYFSGRNFVAMANYVDLDHYNRVAMDRLTLDLRQAKQVISFTTNTVVLEDFDGSELRYSYDSAAKTFSRIKNNQATVILTDCDYLEFTVGQRNPVGGAYDVYPVATPGTAKVVNVSWKCSRKIFGVKANTENVQTARIVIRKQDT